MEDVEETKDGKRNSIINGIPDWVNEEEFALATSLCFTADGSQICWIKYNEEEVPVYDLQLYKGQEPEKAEYKTYPGVYSYKYPKAGERNAKVSAWSFDIKAKKSTELQLPLEKDGYICRLFPTKDPQKVIFITLNRQQNQMCIYATNPRSTLSKLIVKEDAKKYIPEAEYSNIHITDNNILLLSDTPIIP